VLGTLHRFLVGMKHLQRRTFVRKKVSFQIKEALLKAVIAEQSASIQLNPDVDLAGFSIQWGSVVPKAICTNLC
jgi:hypothetical protein